MLVTTTEQEIGPLYVNELYKQKSIPEPVFALGYQGYSNEEASFVDFGTPNERRVKEGALNETTSVDIKIYDDFFWSASLEALRFSSAEEDPVAFRTINEPYTIFDSGSAHLIIANSLYT